MARVDHDQGDADDREQAPGDPEADRCVSARCPRALSRSNCPFSGSGINCPL
jgi:hypothetical protein